MTGLYGVNDIAISLPTIVGARGVEEVWQLAISPEEKAAFGRSADPLKERYRQIDQHV